MDAGVRLADLSPRFLDEHQGPRGAGVSFKCPCGSGHERFVPFDIALDGTRIGYADRGWKRSGDTVETITLEPSIWFKSGCCNWHGFIRNGEIINA